MRNIINTTYNIQNVNIIHQMVIWHYFNVILIHFQIYNIITQTEFKTHMKTFGNICLHKSEIFFKNIFSCSIFYL